MRTVRQMLKVKGGHVWTISKESTVQQSLDLMAEKKIGSLVIVEDSKIIGIFTERGYAREVAPRRINREQTRVEEVMTKDVITVSPDQPVNECLVLMTENNIRHLPVIENDRLVGIISVSDVVKDIIEELEFHVEQLTGYITGLR